MGPIRLAVAGQTITPGGATELLEILGQEESLNRIKQALDILQPADAS